VAFSLSSPRIQPQKLFTPYHWGKAQPVQQCVDYDPISVTVVLVSF
jgi:hypothetical protein